MISSSKIENCYDKVVFWRELERVKKEVERRKKEEGRRKKEEGRRKKKKKQHISRISERSEIS